MKRKRFGHKQFIAQYHEVKDKVFTYLMYRVNFNRETAEDLLMDIILKAYENLDKFDPEKGSFKGWVFAIAHNELVNYWRGNEVRPPTEDLSKYENHTYSKYMADTETSQNMETKKIWQILEFMSASDKEIILLRFMDELNYEEISNVTGKDQGAVRTQLSRALEKFRNLYQKFYPITP